MTRQPHFVTFTVRRLQTFPKDDFPTMQVYGGDLGTPTVRLITCSNFDPDTGSHTGNLIVYAEMTRRSRYRVALACRSGYAGHRGRA